MASFVFDKGAQGLLTGLISWTVTGALGDIRVIWCTAGNNAETLRATAEFVSAITLAEYTGAGYLGPSAPGGAFATRHALASEAATLDATDHAIECDANDLTVAAVSAGAALVTGVIVYQHAAGGDAVSRVIAYMDLAAAGKTFGGSGGDIAFIWDAEGLVKFDNVT